MTVHYMGDYSAYQATLDDLEDFKAIRLEMMRANPWAMARPLSEEENRTREEWQNMITTPKRVNYLVKYKDEVIGQGGILFVDEIPETAIMVGAYLRKGHRGKGITDFVNNILEDWARAHGYDKARTYHREDNYMARNVIRKRGYTLAGEEEKSWADGKTMKQYFYEKSLVI